LLRAPIGEIPLSLERVDDRDSSEVTFTTTEPVDAVLLNDCVLQTVKFAGPFMSAEPFDAVLRREFVLPTIMSPEPSDLVLPNDRVLPTIGLEPCDVQLLVDVVCETIGW
jgi:hypothetical protein